MKFNSIPLEGPTLFPEQGNPTSAVIFLHGYGASGDDLLALGRLWQSSMATTLFLAPHAPFPCESSPMGYQWFSLNNWDPASLLAGALSVLPTLNGFIDSVLDTYQLNTSQIALVGFSQGAMMALQCSLSHSQPLGGVIAYSGALLWPSDQNPLQKPPVLLIHGDQDQVVPPQAFHNAETTLRNLTIPYDAHMLRGLDHSIDERGLSLGLTFLRERLYDKRASSKTA